MTHGGALRVLLAADEDDEARLVTEVLTAGFPTVVLHRIGAGELAARRLPDADCAVIGQASAVELLRRLRAVGFEGGAIVLCERAEPELLARVQPLGATCVERDRMAASLPAAVLERSRAPGDSLPAREMRRMQRLLAMGEMASAFQHEVNNPLTALLAEIQLLEMEPLDESQRAAVERMVELCRRVIATVRRLDPLRPTGSGSEGEVAPAGAGSEGTDDGPAG